MMLGTRGASRICCHTDHSVVTRISIRQMRDDRQYKRCCVEIITEKLKAFAKESKVWKPGWL